MVRELRDESVVLTLPPRSRPGHPKRPQLTEPVQETIVRLVGAGVYLATAAQYAGVHRKTVWR